jgi:membrane dipeptidase
MRAHAGVQRRRLLQAAAACGLVPLPWIARAQSQRTPIADMHSHYGLITRRPLATSGLADELRNQRVALMAWKLVADGPWLRESPTGIEVYRTPQPGQLAATFDTRIAGMKAYLREQRLKTVLTAADVDACIAANGEPGIVLASEGAHFLEGRVDNLKAAYDKGLRHLQFVHFLPSPVGDNQTLAPVHHGLSAMGKQLVEACNAQHVLIDLAHASMEVVEQAVQITKVPLIWSHGWVGRVAGRWLDTVTYKQRRMSLAHAKKIADIGGVVGLWGLALNKPGPAWAAGSDSWTVGLHDTEGYARELANLIGKLGSDHVAIGTDVEGVGKNWSVNDYAGVRDVLEHLRQMKLPSATIERVAYGNYARVLKAVLR